MSFFVLCKFNNSLFVSVSFPINCPKTSIARGCSELLAISSISSKPSCPRSIRLYKFSLAYWKSVSLSSAEITGTKRPVLTTSFLGFSTIPKTSSKWLSTFIGITSLMLLYPYQLLGHSIYLHQKIQKFLRNHNRCQLLQKEVQERLCNEI